MHPMMLLFLLLAAPPLGEAAPNVPTSLPRVERIESANPVDGNSAEGNSVDGNPPKAPATTTKTLVVPATHAVPVAPPTGVSPPGVKSDPPRERIARRISQRIRPATVAPIDRNAPSEEKESSSRKTARQATWWWSSAIGLVLIVGVILVGGRALRWVSPGLETAGARGPITMLYRTPIGPRHSACLICCGDRLLLVGLAGERMTTLAEIRDPTTIDQLKGECEQARPRSATRAFRELFAKERDVFHEEEPAARPRPRERAVEPIGADKDPPRSAKKPDFSEQLESVKARLFGGRGRADA